MADNHPRFGQVTTGDLIAHQLSTLAGAPGSSFDGGITFKAKSTNTGFIYLGHDNTVSAANGFELTAAQIPLFLDILNDEPVWIIQTVAADKLCWATVAA